MNLFRRLWMHLTSRLLYKMVIIYSLLVVTPLIVIISLFYFRSTEIIETKIRETTNQTLVETADKIDGILKLFEQKADNISRDLNANRILKNELDPEMFTLTKEEKSLYTKQLKEQLNLEVAANEMIDAIYIFADNGSVYASEGATEVESYLALTYIAHEVPGKLGWAFFTDNQRLMSAMEIKNVAMEKNIGMISIALKPDKVFEMYASYSDKSFYIANSGDLILSAHDLDSIGSRLRLTGEDKNTIVNKRISLYSGLVYYSMIPKKMLNKEINDLAYFAAGITLAAWIVVLILTVFILRYITNPLVRLARLMRMAEREEFKLLEGVRTHDEIAQLCNSFNRLITEMQNLIQKVYKTELLKKEADLKAIKMHLNPHFLYNTLESVSILAGEAGSKEVPDMIQTLSRILRFSISPIEDFIPLKTEINLAVSYLQLHKYRYKNRLIWQTEMDEELSAIKVPKLILQPIVENAIIHGIDQTGRPGMITIRAYEKDYDLWLEVEDDGPGFTARPSPSGLGTGLDNVTSRIKIYYGQEYGVSMEKRADGASGTVVRIRLPITLENKERDIL
ncbi:sensor histidine kinase [Paenibacillus eucommiae]|uniref:histidine kinase n=1 Tax=Paenibacillus eucommiae TaxID=1355755 RepID=A0ABS4J3R6_9BACL|nr:histidine kinase [Paenibacillus eucommiae]MBP1994482.1 sensor histidine kinase YesM [Paenibacillus eucommiae]